MGTNNIVTATNGDVGTALNCINQFHTAMKEDFVPRNSSGVPTDLGGDLGTDSFGWDNVKGEKYYIGTPGNNNYIADDGSSNIGFYDNSSLVASVDSTGIVRDSMQASGYTISSNSGTFTTNSGSFVDVTNMNVTITAVHGLPVFLFVLANTTSQQGSIGGQASGNFLTAEFQILRDATVVSIFKYSANPNGATSATSQIPPGLVAVDVPSAGTYTYKLQAKLTTGTQVQVRYCSIAAANFI